MTTAEQFRKERESEKRHAQNLVQQHQDKIEKHRSNYMDIWLHRMLQDSEIPNEAAYAKWDLETAKAKEIILMPEVC